MELSALNLYNGNAHRGRANTLARFLPWLICHWQEAKRMQTNNGAARVSAYRQLLGLGVGLYLARKGNPSVSLSRERHVLCEDKLAPTEMCAAAQSELQAEPIVKFNTLASPRQTQGMHSKNLRQHKRIHALFTPLTGFIPWLIGSRQTLHRPDVGSRRLQEGLCLSFP